VNRTAPGTGASGGSVGPCYSAGTERCSTLPTAPPTTSSGPGKGNGTNGKSGKGN
jgi:hypothetical protein